MSKSETELGINSWLQDELYQQYLHDRTTVDETWKHVFDEPRAAQKNGSAVAPAPASAPPAAPSPEPGPGEELQALRGVAGKIAENMSASLSIPLATSQ